MDKMKQWVALAVVAALAIVGGGWFLLVSPKRADAASLRESADARLQANKMLETKLSQLKAQAKDLPAQQAKLAAVAAKIPSNNGLVPLVRALDNAADDIGVELVSIAPSAPTAMAAPAPATPTKDAKASDSSTTASAAPVATSGLMSTSVALTVVGGYFQVAEFLDELENLTRAFRVTTFSLAPGTNPVKSADSQPSPESGKVLTASITGLVFHTTGAAVAAPTIAK